MKEKYVINIDWLQFYCERTRPITEGELIGIDRKYTIKQMAYGTALWQNVYIIESKKLEYATLCCNPRSSAMPEKGVTMKLANRVLYSQEWLRISRELMSLLGLMYKGITRIDVCYDCNRLVGGRSVPEFLMQYFSHAPYCEGHIIRNGSRKVAINAVRSRNGQIGISAMRWGSKGSDIGAYCYNKTLELIEVKDKPWIRDVWQNAGLVNEIDDKVWSSLSDKEKAKAIEDGLSYSYVKTPVWRFEISIKAHGKDLLDFESGSLFSLDINYFDRERAVESLFYTYAAKVMDFRMSTGQTQIRNYPQLVIFEQNMQITERPYRVSAFADTGRTEKIAANKLAQMQETYSDLTSADRHALASAIQFLQEVGGAKASITRKKKEADYLKHMKGKISKMSHIDEYLAYVDYCYQKRIGINAKAAYNNWESLMMELQLLDMSPQDSAVTPVW